MTVSSTTSRVSYAGDDSTVSFPIPFNFTANADIVAVLADSAGDETTWTITTDYTLAGAGGTSGGTLTAVTAPATGETLVIYRDPEIKQLVDYVENDPFPADTHEGALDKLTYICQALDEKVGRALLQPVTSSSSNVTFAPPDAGKVLLWNATGTAVTNGPDADEITNAQSYATAAAASAAAAAASAATVPDFPEITGNGGKYLKANAGATALEYGALGTAALATLGTSANNALQLNASAKVPSGVYDFATDATMEAGTDETQPANAKGVAAAIAALAGGGGMFEPVSGPTAFTNQTTIELTGLEAGYEYKVIFDQWRPASSASMARVTLGYGGTPTYVASNYKTYQFRFNTAAAAEDGATTYFNLKNFDIANTHLNGRLEFLLSSTSNRYPYIVGETICWYSTASVLHREGFHGFVDMGSGNTPSAIKFTFTAAMNGYYTLYRRAI